MVQEGPCSSAQHHVTSTVFSHSQNADGFEGHDCQSEADGLENLDWRMTASQKLMVLRTFIGG